MVNQEATPKPIVSPSVASYIEEISGGILPLQRLLTDVAVVNGVTEPEALQALIPKVHGTGLGGDPEALLHAMGWTVE